MTGNGKHTTYKNADDWGMVYVCFTHIIFQTTNMLSSLIGYPIHHHQLSLIFRWIIPYWVKSLILLIKRPILLVI